MHTKTCLWFITMMISGIASAACPNVPVPYEPYKVGTFELAIDGNVITSCAAYSLLLDPKTYQEDMNESLFYPLVESVASELQVSPEQASPLFLEANEISGPMALDDVSALKMFGVDEGYVVAISLQVDRLYDLVRIVGILFPIPGPPQTVSPVPAPFNQPDVTIQEQQRYVWENLAIIVETVEDGSYLEEQVRVVDGNGSTLVELEDYRITDVSFHELDGQGAKELVVSTWSGGNHCCFMQYIYTSGNPIQEIYAHETTATFEDLNGDGKEELVQSGVVYLGDLPMCCYPSYNRVDGWNGEEFVDQTNLYPILAERNMEKNRMDFLDASAKNDEISQYSAELGFMPTR